MCGLTALGLTAVGALSTSTLGKARLLVAAGFTVATASVAFCLLALYQPSFELSSAVSGH